MSDPVDEICALYAERGDSQYGGEAVTQLQHGLQCAARAEADGHPPALVVAALLHDIGHLVHDLGENPGALGIDDAHETRGERFLRDRFGPEVVEPIRLHVAAKRYLCAVDPDYHATLSPQSQRTLTLQGGPMRADEAAAFIASPGAADAVVLRRYDDLAKDPAATTPGLGHYRSLIRRCLAPASSAQEP